MSEWKPKYGCTYCDECAACGSHHMETIDSLYAQLAEKDKQIADLEQLMSVQLDMVSKLDEANKRIEELENKHAELLSYMPKVPTQPYEKELAMRIEKLEAALERIDIGLCPLISDPCGFDANAESKETLVEIIKYHDELLAELLSMAREALADSEGES